MEWKLDCDLSKNKRLFAYGKIRPLCSEDLMDITFKIGLRTVSLYVFK